MCWYEMNREFCFSFNGQLGDSVTKPWMHKLIPWLADFMMGLRVEGEVDAPGCLGPLPWEADLMSSPALKVWKSRRLPGMP